MKTDPDAEESASPPSPPLAIHAMPGHLIRRLHQASQAIFEAQVQASGHDLTPVQFAALSVIAARPGLDQATLSDEIAFDRATTGGVIDRLQAKGLVRREIAAGDRRARRLYAEPVGRMVLDGVMPAVAQAQSAMLAGLSAAERAQFLKLAGKALAAVVDASRTSVSARGRGRPASGKRS